MAKRTALTLVAAAMAFVALPAGGASASHNRAHPTGTNCVLPPPKPMPPPGDFVPGVDNRYFPLSPGTTLLYRGFEERDRVRDAVTVTHRTRMIVGVRATVVVDMVWLNGRPAEKTFDWYAQDKQGDVWYMGEAAFDRVHHRWVRAPDSWEAGRHGAKAGIIMEAHPKVGDAYRQEFSRGNAEDMGQVLRTQASVSVPFGSFRHVLKTRECSPLEQGVIDHKYYARGVGEVRETTVAGGSADLELVSIRHD